MAADAYLRVAITQLQSAIGDLQSQITASHQNITQQKQQMQQEITKLERERGLHDSALPSMEDDSQKHALLDRVNHINKQCDDMKAQMARLDSEHASLVQRKTQLHDNLKNLANQLEVFIASPDIR